MKNRATHPLENTQNLFHKQNIIGIQTKLFNSFKDEYSCLPAYLKHKLLLLFKIVNYNFNIKELHLEMFNLVNYKQFSVEHIKLVKRIDLLILRE
jgi:hypothetical protein